MLISRTMFQHKSCWFWLILIYHKESYDQKCEGGVWISGFQFEEKMAALLAYFRLSLTHASQNSFLFCLFLHLGVHPTYTQKKSQFLSFFSQFFHLYGKKGYFLPILFLLIWYSFHTRILLKLSQKHNNIAKFES